MKATSTAIPIAADDATLLPIAPPVLLDPDGVPVEVAVDDEDEAVGAALAGAPVVELLGDPEGSEAVIWVISAGTVMGDPSGFTAPWLLSNIPGLALNVSRVWRMFWTNCSCSSVGTSVMSMLSPHV